MKTLFVVLMLFLMSCTKQPVASIPPDPAQAAHSPKLAWESSKRPEASEWSKLVYSLVLEKIDSFDQATNIGEYCPKYATLSADKRAHVWSVMIVEIAEHESSYKPDTVFHEPPPLGVDSIGLFQLSYEDKFSWCKMGDAGKKVNSLKDPLENIRCAVPKMASLVKADKVVAKGKRGGSRSERAGLGRYWSVTWENTHRSDIVQAAQSLAFCK